ncbi:hypothetical protein SELMODRAFT_429678 [Selaginella moellendorffii]|uniref:Uncharacterized protein n=1 Tax=Selaginella moellendorffii TaxID=88036 RepID=D8T6Y3_SELML|nr:hypothetical protein SELMODRAFT_429678 [Selaginella moellendorffii]
MGYIAGVVKLPNNRKQVTSMLQTKGMPPGCIKIIENYNSRSSLQVSNITDEVKPMLKFLISTPEMCKSSSSTSKAIAILYDDLQHKIKVDITSYLHKKLIKEIHLATKLIHSSQKCETLAFPYVAALVSALDSAFPLSVKVPPTTPQTRRKWECKSKRREDLLHISEEEDEEEEEQEDKKELLPLTMTPPAKRTKMTTGSPPKNRTTTNQIESIISKEELEEKSQEQNQEINLDSITTPTNSVAVHTKKEGRASPPAKAPVDNSTMPQHREHHSKERPDQE